MDRHIGNRHVLTKRAGDQGEDAAVGREVVWEADFDTEAARCQTPIKHCLRFPPIPTPRTEADRHETTPDPFLNIFDPPPADWGGRVIPHHEMYPFDGRLSGLVRCAAWVDNAESRAVLRLKVPMDEAQAPIVAVQVRSAG